MKDKHDIHVKIGEIKTGRAGDILKATLGSCVGIAIIWKEKNIAGLAHCLLPQSPVPLNEIGAKYVNQAVASLKALLKITPENVHEVCVFIAGGGNMMAQLTNKNTDHIGIQNIKAARENLKLSGFAYKELEVGGDEGRQMIVDCDSGTVSIIRFERSLPAI